MNDRKNYVPIEPPKKPVRKPRKWQLIWPLALMAYASWMLFNGYTEIKLPVAESQLKFAKGIPTNVQTFNRVGRLGHETQVTRFTIDGHQLQVDEFVPQYEEIRAVVSRERAVTVWIDPTVSGEVKSISKLIAESRVILHYDESAEATQSILNGYLVFGALMLFISIVGLTYWVWKSSVAKSQKVAVGNKAPWMT